MSKITRRATETGVYTNNPLMRTLTEPYSHVAPQGILVEERDAKIEELTRHIETKITESVENQIGYNEITGTLETQPEKSEHFYYFIGRLNPPHNGHIKALSILVQMATSSNSVALILLGSGPKQERTLDNPITFELKKTFIEQQFAEQNLSPTNYNIQQMTNPAKNVSEFIAQQLEILGDTLDNIRITHIAGGKDEDTTKLDFVKKIAEKTAQGIVPGATISTGVEVIDPAPTDSGEAMSATKVRKDAYRTLLDGSGFAGWAEKYGHFYGQLSESIYDEILFPINSIPEEQRVETINNYINPTIVEKPAKRKDRPSAGLTTEKKGKTKGGTKRKRRRPIKNSRRKRRVSRKNNI